MDSSKSSLGQTVTYGMAFNRRHSGIVLCDLGTVLRGECSMVVDFDGLVSLDSVDPLSLVSPAVLPEHLSVAVSVVVFEVAYIPDPAFPDVGAFTVFLVVHVFTVVAISLNHVPFAAAVAHA